jgi:hypothetical protein
MSHLLFDWPAGHQAVYREAKKRIAQISDFYLIDPTDSRSIGRCWDRANELYQMHRNPACYTICAEVLVKYYLPDETY